MTSFSTQRKEQNIMRYKPATNPEGVEIGGRQFLKPLLIAALVAATAVLVVPAMARADARVSTNVPCVAYANGGATFYSGSGTEVVTNGGDVRTSCHLTLVSGTPVAQPTRTTYGNCELLQVPSGRAELSCHYALV
jgi:hypothetical protein